MDFGDIPNMIKGFPKNGLVLLLMVQKSGEKTTWDV